MAHLLMKLFALSLALLAACGGGDDDTTFAAADIRATAPSGQMEGRAWTMMKAVVRQDPFEMNELSVSLYADAVEDCALSPAAPSGEILFSVHRMMGEYPFRFSLTGGDNQTATFVPSPGRNVVSTTGLIAITALSETEITLGIVAEAGSSSVNGTFTAAVCD